MSDAASTGIPDTGEASAANAAAGKPSRVRRIAHVLVALLVFVVLPMVLVGALVGEFGVGAMAVGLVLGVAGSKIGGTRRMAYLAPAIGVAGGLGRSPPMTGGGWRYWPPSG
jgi:nitrate reductase NapE component